MVYGPSNQPTTWYYYEKVFLGYIKTLFVNQSTILMQQLRHDVYLLNFLKFLVTDLFD